MGRSIITKENYVCSDPKMPNDLNWQADLDTKYFTKKGKSGSSRPEQTKTNKTKTK